MYDRTLPDNYYLSNIDGKLIPHSVNPGPMLMCPGCQHTRFGSDFVAREGAAPICRYCSSTRPSSSPISSRTRLLSTLVALALATAPVAAHASEPKTVAGVVVQDDDAATIARAKAEIARAKAHKALARAEARAVKAQAAAERAARAAKTAQDRLAAARAKAK